MRDRKSRGLRELDDALEAAAEVALLVAAMGLNVSLTAELDLVAPHHVVLDHARTELGPLTTHQLGEDAVGRFHLLELEERGDRVTGARTLRGGPAVGRELARLGRDR